MKRILTAIVFSLVALSAAAQTQRVVVKTPGRQQDDGSITKGQRIAEAFVTVQGGNTYESDTNGELRMGKPSAGKYRFSSVRKEGYELSDADFLMRSYIYSDAEPLYITLVKPSEQLEVQLYAEQKVRRTLKQQLERVESEIERQYEAQKITEEEYYQRLQQVYDDIERNDKLIGYMSERYAGLDFDCMDEFNRELNRLIINGELAKADSLLITAGDIESEYAALLRHRAINQELHHDIEQSEEFTRKRIEDIASRCYSKHQIHSLRYERDSAAYYLELRAELDPENMEWQVELAEYLIEYIADYDTALKFYIYKKELLEETNELYNLIPQSTQIIACTATINQFTKRFFAGINNVILPNEDILTKRITHWAIYAEQRDKIETLRKFLLAEKPGKVLIFTSRADQVENITSKLKYKNFECASIHAKSDKQERKATLDRFRSGKNKILITSDLAARGLDIPNITHIVQMDLPSDEDFFIHRSGRTARAGKTGINVVIGDEFEMNQFAKLEKKLKITVYPKEIYGGKVLAPRMD